MPVQTIVTSRHVMPRHATSRHVTPRHDVVQTKIGVNRRNIYNSTQVVLASRPRSVHGTSRLRSVR